jgi:hypothetical protein
MDFTFLDEKKIFIQKINHHIFELNLQANNYKGKYKKITSQSNRSDKGRILIKSGQPAIAVAVRGSPENIANADVVISSGSVGANLIFAPTLVSDIG